MSHSDGKIVCAGKVIGYFEYNGTCDVAISAIWDTYDEMHEHWRSGVWNNCTCHEQPTEVLIWTSYGAGFYWPGKVCLPCRAITDGQMPFDESIKITDGEAPVK